MNCFLILNIEWTTLILTVCRYAPGFKASIVGKEVLPPPDLEAVFGLTGGNIFHGSMSLDQLYLTRPTGQSKYFSSMKIFQLRLKIFQPTTRQAPPPLCLACSSVAVGPTLVVESWGLRAG